MIEQQKQQEDDPFAPDTTAADPDSLFWADADSVDTEDSFAEQQAEPSGEEVEPGLQSPPQDQEPSEPVEESPVTPAPAPTEAYPEGAILEFRILEFGVSYPTVKRPFLMLGRSSVHRLGGVYLQGSHILGPEGTILEVASGQSHRQDRLSGSTRSLAEGATYPFQRPEIPPSRLGRYVEPVVVVGIIGSLVYLFYQNQN
jgi:hypothetical protein